MNITHPFLGKAKTLDVPENVVAFVKSLKALPTAKRDAANWPWWAERKLDVGAGAGVVPAGDYTKPDSPEALAALEGLYKHLGGTKLNRQRVALALNLQTDKDVDRMLAQLKKDGKVGPVITPGARGISRSAVVADVVKAQAAKQAAKAPVKKAANGNGRQAKAS